MESKNYIQQIIKDLTSNMDLIISQLKLIFDFVDKFKHKRHLIIYSYLLGYYASKGNNNFNQNILFDSIEIFNKSLTRKTELSNLIIAVSLSINKREEESNKNEQDDGPRIDITETMLSNDPYTAYKDLFGDTVLEKPLSDTIINNLTKINSNNIENNLKNDNQNNIMVNYKKKTTKELSDIKENVNENRLNDEKNNIIENNNNEERINNNKNKNIIIKDYSKNIFNDKKNITKKLVPEDNHKKKEIYDIGFNILDANSNNKQIKNFEKGLQPKNVKKIFKCFICSGNLNGLDKHYYKLDCKHIIHSNCFKNYVKNSIKNKEIPILCPKCKKEINTDLIYKSLNSIGDSNLVKQYEKLCFELYIKNADVTNNGITYYCCPTQGCNKYIPCKKNETKLSCPKCNKEYCINCFRPWHKDKNCEEFIIQNNNNDSKLNKEFYDIIVNDKYKECPNCKALMIKEKGTNKISCVCGNIFCYKCGKIMKEKHECS